MTASLSDVAAALPSAERRGDDVALADATHDSRQVGPGWLFCAVRGRSVDGHDLAPAAVEQGAAALLVDRWLDLPVPQVRVPSVREAAGPAAAVVHGNPSEQLRVVGVTGTNGKTTTVYLLEAAFAAAAMGTGVIGTVETRIHGETQPGVRTTPEGPDLQRLLRRMYDRGADAVAMEVSSHGLDLHRVDGTRFAVGVWTNLSQDHLDWHETMEAYFAAKARLFTPGLTDRGVVHLDSPWARRLLEVAEVPLTTLGRDDDADIRIVDEHADVTGSRARLVGDGIDLAIGTAFPGRFNLSNAATAVVAAVAAGVPAEVAARGVAACPGAPGRLERVDVGQPFTVLVDYAHTPDAVEQVLATVRDLLEPDRRVLVVLGAGGDRDRAKRGPMGAAAAGADVAVLTSDNPRTEDPRAILDAVAAGANGAVTAGAPAEVHVEVDRRDAIAWALANARDGDVVVIAGKGHETGQEFADRTLPFDDRQVARELLQETRP
ncbi:UDP-N-acetylmuramoyl-L-alanyl-D-glutamate--2,6-diaminopimelate ligase [Egicoccus sp. AB-alg6-2]|uniref:UDP-N-acetylmuramoyl-L-alanyl-D-glutamate--2, 6-diaminopimelate ligase n=1 Tax=Egicoccus sp. AB-alg6-2 TaxID=3242692 RepID=UPI00359E843B